MVWLSLHGDVVAAYGATALPRGRWLGADHQDLRVTFQTLETHLFPDTAAQLKDDRAALWQVR
jgi:hypothetical protein